MYLKTLLTIGLPSATLAIGKSPLRHHLQPRIATELVMCTADWMPVCGSDGNVYGNACEAEAAGSEVMYEIEAPGDDLAPGDNCFAPLGPTWNARTYLNASGVLVDVAENTSITLKFENGTFGGSSSCNKYQNAFTNATNASFAVGDQLSLTMMMCDEELMSQEREYLAIFNGTLTYAVYGDSIGLELADDSGKVVAQYAAQADPPAICTMDWRPVCGSDGKVYGNACEAEVAGLEAMYEIESPDSGLATGDSCFAAVGRTWNAQMYLNASGALVDVAANSFITLKFDNGTFSGSSSCNKYRGTYANATNASFAVGDQLSSSMMMCEEELMSQEQDYLAIFNGTVAYSVSEDPTGLELTDSAGNVLAIYVTEADAPAPSNSKGQAAPAFLSEQDEDEKSGAITAGTSIATLAVVVLVAIS